MARIISKGHSFGDVLLVPRYSTIVSRKNVDFRTRITRRHTIDIPLIAANMDTICEAKMAIALGKMGGLGVIHRFLTITEQAEELAKVKKENLLSAAAIGVKDYSERVPALVQAGVDILVLDIAHGHTKYVGATLDWLKEKFPHIDVLVGNIATKDAAHYLFSKGADGIKVGVGPGSMCTTRIMSGAGIPQITALMDVYESTQGRVPICADGGIRNPGDVVKAIGAGADSVMIGFMLSGTEETPGEIIQEHGKAYKLYRGMASYDATIRRLALDGKMEEEIISVEGEKTKIDYKGPIEPIIKRLLGGLASGMTYVGAQTIESLRGKADFVEISESGQEESRAHGLDS